MAVAVRPRPELLDDPGAEAGRRVHEPVPKRLGAGRLLRGVPGLPLLGVLHRGERRPLRLGEVVERGRVGCRDGRVDVDPGDVLRVLLADARRDARPPVAALRTVALVAEPGHQPGPGAGDPFHVPAGPGRLVAEAVPGK